jgi:hypothetical protein
MSTAIAGSLSATIDGKAYNVSGEATYRPSGDKRETLTGQDGVHGFSAMPQPGKIAFKGRDASTVSIGALSNAFDATVVLSLANGKVVIGRNMWRVGEAAIEVNTEDGTFAVEFEGPEVTEN